MAMSSLGHELPKYSEIVCALTPLADKFFELGTQLDLDYKQLKAIKNDNNGNQSLCLHDTIYLWQQNNTSGECSWSTLAEAVKRVGGHNNLVSELKERDSKPQVLHYPPEPTERANEGCVSVSDSTLQRCDSRPSESEDESGYSSKSDSIQSGDSSGSEVECFELAAGCGCTAAGKKSCSLYTLCAGGCPNPTRKRVPVLRKKSMSSQSEIPFEEEYDFEDYEERTKEIQKLFGTFVCKMSRHFKKSNVDIKELTLYLQSTKHQVMKPRMEELSKVTHFADFFRIVIDQACSWFDYGIIKDLILSFCASAKSCLDEYEACFKKYAEQRLPKGLKHIEIGSGARKGGKQLVIKIDRKWDEVTFSDLDKLRGTFASILGPGVCRSDLYLADIREGCIMMSFMITEELAGRLFPSRTCLTSTQVKSLKDEGVLSMKCGSLSWRAAASNNKSDVARLETRAITVHPKSLSLAIDWRSKLYAQISEHKDADSLTFLTQVRFIPEIISRYRSSDRMTVSHRMLEMLEMLEIDLKSIYKCHSGQSRLARACTIIDYLPLSPSSSFSGSHTSEPRTQAVLIYQSEALKILTQPQCQGAVNGDKVTFAVVAEGPEYLTYEWLKHSVPISDLSAKARSSTFTIPSILLVEHKGSYQCIVSSDYDGSVNLAMSKPAESKDLLDKARSIQKPLAIVFPGRVGRGKSTLFNSLFGKAVVMESDLHGQIELAITHAITGHICTDGFEWSATWEAAFNARAKWKDIGRYIGIDEVILDTLRGSDSDCLYEALKHRVYKPGEPNSKPRTWRTLIEALQTRAVNEEAMANELEKEKYLDTDQGGSAEKFLPLASCWETIGTGGSLKKLLSLYSSWKTFGILLEIPKSVLDTIKSHEEKKLLPLDSRWETIGTLLRVSKPVLDEIKSDEEGVNDRLQEMLSEWLTRSSSLNMWRAVCKH